MGFRSSGRHLDRSETVAFREAAADGGLGRRRARQREPPAPFVARHRRPGCPGAAKRRGIGRKRPILRSLLPTRSFVVKRGSRPTASARASGSFFTGDPGSRSRRLGASRASEGGDHASVIHVRPRAATRERGARDREDRGSLVRHGRGSAARGTCSWVVSGCRSRRASPTVQRSVRPPLPKPNEVGADGT